MTYIAERLRADIRKLAPHIAARAKEIEAARRIPPDLVETLRSIGVFRMFVPHSQGGLEVDLPTALEVIASLTRIDGSVGWNVATCNGGHAFASSLSREMHNELYSNGPDVLIAGSAQPVGTAEPTDGGWLVNGRWPFASGCQYADWMFALCIQKSEPPGPETGPPNVRGFFLPAREWEIEDTWHVAGLQGTGSHHITLRNKWVPAANFFDFPCAAPCVSGPLYQGVSQLLPMVLGAISVGIAEGALDEIVELANTGRRQLRASVPMRESEVFQSELGRVEADVRAARALLQVQARTYWLHALSGSFNAEMLHSQATQSAIWIASTCVRSADACFVLGSDNTVYNTSPLQRRLRDLQTAAQHAAAHQRHYVKAGKLLLSQPANSKATTPPPAASASGGKRHILHLRPRETPRPARA